MSENILSAFKNELGYVNSTNQYVELSVRIVERDYELTQKNNLQVLAKSVNLNVSTLAEGYMLRISKSYIVNIHSCFESFLRSFKHLPGSPTNMTKTEKNDDDSWLKWTLDIAISNNVKGIENDVAICEYYRLIRNAIVHNGNYSAEMKNKRALIKDTGNPRLNAPNDMDSLIFDDQVLFSRAAYNVAKFIFNNSQYDLDAIVEANKKTLTNLIKPFQEPGSHLRAAQKVEHFVGLLYPQFTDANWKEKVDKLLGQINEALA